MTVNTSRAPPEPRVEGMAGLAKGLAILELFSGSRDALTIAAAAEATGLSRATARRCLMTLNELGYLGFDGKFFRPQPRLMRLGFAYLNADPLTRIAQPVMAGIRDRTGESVSLAVLDGDDSLFVARAPAVHIVATGISQGVRRPAHELATGRVLLAGLDEAAFRDYLGRARFTRRTDRTVIDADALTAAVTRAAAVGYALNDEESEIGFRALAVPVFGTGQGVIAALSIGSSSARIDAEAMVREYLPLLVAGAQALGQLMLPDHLTLRGPRR
jgi:IclR family pca regulon transcriptional regulator